MDTIKINHAELRQKLLEILKLTDLIYNIRT